MEEPSLRSSDGAFRPKISVALPTFNERASIRACIEGFFSTGVVDEIVVCNNNAATGTSDEVASTKARRSSRAGKAMAGPAGRRWKKPRVTC